MTVETKRIVKKVAKHSVWAASDILFLAIKALGTLLLIVVTTGVVFSALFLIYLRNNLTDSFDVNTINFSMNQSSVIYYTDADGRIRELVTIQSDEFRRQIDFEELPEHLINALVSIEDHRFFRHQGVDWYRTAGAFTNMFLTMRENFGGSTITQQLIKNLTQEDDVTVQRKMLEIFRALEYERQFEKDEILETYLNLVYFGHGQYGIGAAAHYYFNKDVSELTLAESAAIIGITNNPSKYSPYVNKEANKERQEIILNRMYALGYIETEQELQRAKNARLNFQRGEDEGYVQVIYTWFEEAVIRDVIADLQTEFGWAEPIARRTLYTGGLRIYATIDPEMQEIVDNVYQNRDALPTVTGSSQPLQSGIIVADPYTGEIRALSGGVGRKTRNLLLNRATMTRRPPGSSLKPLAVYAPAMDGGLISPETQFEDSADVTLSGTTWMPRNASRTYTAGGIVNVRSAIRQSLNTTPAIILDNLTPARSYRFLRDALGFNLDPADENYAPLAAGQLTYGATVREMASGFTMFPNMGERVALRTYTHINDSAGNLYLDNRPQYTTAIGVATAYWMTDMLREAVQRGTGTSANLGRMPTAGKTGTTSDNKDRWFVGFTPYYIAAVWTGFDTPAAMRSSANPAAQIWKMVMEPIHEGLEVIPFNDPGERERYLRPVQGIATSDYTIRCIDNFGELLSEENRPAVVGRSISATAPTIDGYVITGENYRTISIQMEANRNLIIFIYEPEEEESIEDPEDTEDTENPEDAVDPGDSEVPEDFEEQFGTDDPEPSPDTPEDPPPDDPNEPEQSTDPPP